LKGASWFLRPIEPYPKTTMSADSDLFVPRQHRRQRQAFSSPPCLVESPTDSGYGSSCTPPTTPEPSEKTSRRPTQELWMLGDGNRSDLDGDSEQSENNVPIHDSPTVAVAARRRLSNSRRQKPFTLPIRSARARPPLPAAFLSDSGAGISRRRSNIGPVRSRTSSLRLPDRFVPTRTQSTNTVDKYRTGKEWNELTSTERILRHNGATEDAFVYRRRVVTPMASDFRLQSRSETVISHNRG